MLSPEGLVAAITAAAVAIADDRSQEQISLLGAVFTQLGDTLATIAAARDLCASQETESKPSGGS